MNFMQSQCDGSRSCRIQADTFKISKDPCPGTERYLEAHFKCIPNQGKHGLFDSGEFDMFDSCVIL